MVYRMSEVNRVNHYTYRGYICTGSCCNCTTCDFFFFFISKFKAYVFNINHSH